MIEEKSTAIFGFCMGWSASLLFTACTTQKDAQNQGPRILGNSVEMMIQTLQIDTEPGLGTEGNSPGPM